MDRSITAGACALPAFVILSFAADRAPAVPAGLPPLVWPANNSYSAEKAELGRYLYFDRRLSADGTVSCASCHDPRHGFTDGAAVSTGIRGQKGTRSAPTILNRAYSLAQFWDGRAATLEEQAIVPMESTFEMGTTHQAVVATLVGRVLSYQIKHEIVERRPVVVLATNRGVEPSGQDGTAPVIQPVQNGVICGMASYEFLKRHLRSLIYLVRA